MYNPQKVRDIEFDLSICESNANPTFRMASNELLLELFRMGQISLEMMLENGSFPFADRLLQSIQQAKERMEQAAQNNSMQAGTGLMQGVNGQAEPMVPADIQAALLQNTRPEIALQLQNMTA